MPIASNPVFPRSSLGAGAVALPFVRSPIWQTRGPKSVAGVEVLQADWSYPRYQWKANIAYLRQAAAFGELATLIGFYNKVAARYGVFQYDETSDDTVSTDQSIGTGDGVTTTFQLVRSYGGFIEPVFAVNAITTVKKNGVTLASPADYSVSNKGVVTFTSPPAAAATLTWTGTFLWFVRFDTDQQEFNMLVGALAANPYGPLWSANLAFSSIKMGS